MLSKFQAEELHKAMLEYLCNSQQFTETAKAFAS